MRIVIDTAKCTGHGQCYFLAPELVEDDERGYGRVRDDGTIGPGQLEAAERARELCPERAVELMEEQQ